MEELESQLKKGNDTEELLQNLLTEIRSVKQQNAQLHNKVDRLEEKLEGREIYNNSSSNTYLSNKPDSQVEEFKRRLRKDGKEGVDVSIISTIFQIKPRQAYNVKDRIVDEEDWIAEIPKSNEKDRVVSKKHYLVKVIKEDYPTLPSSIYDETGEAVAEKSWTFLFKAYADNVFQASVDDRVSKLESLAEWFDAESLHPEL